MAGPPARQILGLPPVGRKTLTRLWHTRGTFPTYLETTLLYLDTTRKAHPDQACAACALARKCP